MLKLISATPSPYARKVRIALKEKQVPFELLTEVPWNGDTKTPLYNPLEKLPVLILPTDKADSVPGFATNGHSAVKKPTAVYESHYILEYLEAKYPEPALLPRDIDAKLAAKQIEVVSDGMCDALVLAFFERQREHPSDEWKARQMRKVDGGMRWLAEKVDEAHGDFLIGESLGLADIAVGAVLGYLEVRLSEYQGHQLPLIPRLGDHADCAQVLTDEQWKDKYPKLAAYNERLKQRKSFQETVPSPQTIKDKIV